MEQVYRFNFWASGIRFSLAGPIGKESGNSFAK